MQAYLVLANPLPPGADREANFQKGLQNVENDPKLTSEQRQIIIGNMHKSHERNKAMLAMAERDAPAVRPHMAELKRVLAVD